MSPVSTREHFAQPAPPKREYTDDDAFDDMFDDEAFLQQVEAYDTNKENGPPVEEMDEDELAMFEAVEREQHGAAIKEDSLSDLDDEMLEALDRIEAAAASSSTLKSSSSSAPSRPSTVAKKKDIVINIDSDDDRPAPPPRPTQSQSQSQSRKRRKFDDDVIEISD